MQRQSALSNQQATELSAAVTYSPKDDSGDDDDNNDDDDDNDDADNISKLSTPAHNRHRLYLH
jgi:hypothetical protein